MSQQIIIWDNDGTIMGSKNPNDRSDSAKQLLPNVEHIMNEKNHFNIICSGCKTPESEMQNFDPHLIISKFHDLMKKLPIQIATFSPAIGGTECYALIKERFSGTISVREVHKNSRYTDLIGQFKKPGIGMFVVLKDILKEDFAIEVNDLKNILMIGDSWHDEAFAEKSGCSFLNAKKIHQNEVRSFK